jgi:hypothetical protein
MLRGEQHERQRSGGGPRPQEACGLGAVVPTPLAPGRKRRTGVGTTPLLGAAFLLGVFVTGAMLQNMRAEPAATVDCTALLLDRDTGRTVAVPCAGDAPSLPSTLTALLPTGLPDHVAATR